MRGSEYGARKHDKPSGEITPGPDYDGDSPAARNAEYDRFHFVSFRLGKTRLRTRCVRERAL